MIDFYPLFGESAGSASELRSFRVFPKTGSARWMLERRFTRPWHLKTWPRTTYRSRFIYRALWMMSFMRLHLPSRFDDFAVAHGSVYDCLSRDFDRLGVFLGTPGPNRKFVVYAARPDCSVFVKIPLAPGSFAQIERERVALNMLSTDPDIAPFLPAHYDIVGHLGLEDIEAGGARFGRLSLAEVRRVCDLLARRSRRTMPLIDQRVEWESPPPGLPLDHDSATRALISGTRSAARKFLDGLPKGLIVDIYDAHGDFTLWNALKLSDGSARIIDWEMFGPKPMWFDLVHYYVSQDILIKNSAPAKILGRLERIGEKLDLGNNWCYSLGLYFAVQALMYCGIYERQYDLHPQARTQLFVWQQILNMLVENGAGVTKVGEPHQSCL